METAINMLPLVALALIFWFMVVRPASRQRKQVMELQAGLKAGDRVMLGSGIFGEIVGVDEAAVRVQVADGVVLEVARGGITAVDSRDAAGADAAAADSIDSGEGTDEGGR